MNKIISLIGLTCLSLSMADAKTEQQFALGRLQHAQPTTGYIIEDCRFNGAQRGPRRADEQSNPTILYNTPRGLMTHYALTLHASTPIGFQTMNALSDDICIDGNDIWIGNLSPLSFVGNAWVHGTIDGNGDIVIKPAPLISTDFGGYLDEVATLAMGKLILSDPDADNKVSVLGIDTEGIKLHMDKDGQITSADKTAYIALYFCDADAKPILSEKGTVQVDSYSYGVEMIPAVLPCQVPEGAEFEPYSVIYNNTSGNSKTELGAVYMDGEDVYLQGAMPTMPKAVIKGKLVDDKVIVPSYQGLGDEPASEDYNWLGYFGDFVRLYVGLQLNPSTGQARVMDEVTFTYTQYNEQFVLDDNYLMAKFYGNAAGIIDYASAVGFMPFNTIGVLQPAAPKQINLSDMSEKYGTTTMQVIFYWDNRSIDGEYIDPATLSYRMFLDNYLVEFTPDAYPGLPALANPTELPWSTDCEGIYPYELFGMKMHICFIYDDLFNELGIQAINEEDGERAYSDITRIDRDGNALESIPAEGIERVGIDPTAQVSYYDLHGRSLSASARGTFSIARVQMADGSIRTMKVLKR